MRGSDFRVPILAVAVGIYLPISLSLPIFIGGMLSHFALGPRSNGEAGKKGLLLASGLISGEALMGIMVAVPIFITTRKDWWPHIQGFGWLGIIVFIAIGIWLFRTARSRTTSNSA
jgi:uncharacterized oligopeptide transporter (OPT) family protein